MWSVHIKIHVPILKLFINIKIISIYMMIHVLPNTFQHDLWILSPNLRAW